jgi:hypothetical protein
MPRGCLTESGAKPKIFIRRREEVNGAPKEIRTPSLLIRSQVLYPVELWVRAPQKGAAT